MRHLTFIEDELGSFGHSWAVFERVGSDAELVSALDPNSTQLLNGKPESTPSRAAT